MSLRYEFAEMAHAVDHLKLDVLITSRPERPPANCYAGPAPNGYDLGSITL